MLVYLYISKGITVYYAESMETIGDNIREVQPHFFSAVPRLLEKVYEKIMAKGAELSGIKKTLFDWAVNLGLKYEFAGTNGWWYDFQLSLANKVIFNKWREALGGNLICLVCGSAALQPRLARIFTAAQIPVLEGYGLTETSPVVTVNRFNEDERKFATVGPVIPGVDVKIAEDGEILVKGPNVMMGYYKQPDETLKVLNEGWFHTGDIGTFIEDKFLKITDRKKQIFKTSGGKYVAPQPIQNKFKESGLIEQIMVVGEGRKFTSALIVPSFDNLKKWCSEQGVSCASNDEYITNEKVLAEFKRIVDGFNPNFSHIEQIKKFKLIPKEWTVESGELTPTMKPKRKVILESCKEYIEKMYS